MQTFIQHSGGPSARMRMGRRLCSLSRNWLPHERVFHRWLNAVGICKTPRNDMRFDRRDDRVCEIGEQVREVSVPVDL
jgi:hypothetical protein